VKTKISRIHLIKHWWKRGTSMKKYGNFWESIMNWGFYLILRKRAIMKPKRNWNKWNNARNKPKDITKMLLNIKKTNSAILQINYRRKKQVMSAQDHLSQNSKVNWPIHWLRQFSKLSKNTRDDWLTLFLILIYTYRMIIASNFLVEMEVLMIFMKWNMIFMNL
jgi:hypothetical protein